MDSKCYCGPSGRVFMTLQGFLTLLRSYCLVSPEFSLHSVRSQTTNMRELFVFLLKFWVSSATRTLVHAEATKYLDILPSHPSSRTKLSRAADPRQYEGEDTMVICSSIVLGSFSMRRFCRPGLLISHSNRATQH